MDCASFPFLFCYIILFGERRGGAFSSGFEVREGACEREWQMTMRLRSGMRQPREGTTA
jgi:hypothetical protein